MDDSLYASIKTDWHEKAACARSTGREFFPAIETDALLAEVQQEFCNHCPVWAKCLNSAIVHNDSGFWGGTSTETRRALKRKRHRVKCPACSGMHLVVIDQDTENNIPACEICLACGASWKGDAGKTPEAPMEVGLSCL